MGTAIANPMNSIENTSLLNHKKTIDEGCEVFIGVGKALMAIRDEKLYRESHKSFTAFCDENWGFTDRRARQLIDGAEVAQTVEKTGTRVPLLSEAQARPLTQVPEEDQPDVWQNAVEIADGGQPSGSTVREAVTQYLSQEPDEDDIIDVDPVEPDEDAPLPDDPEEENIADILSDHNKAIESYCRSVMALVKVKPDVAWLDHKGRWEGMQRKIKQGLDTLRSAKCVICPGCEGVGCTDCKDYGFLPTIDAGSISG